MLSFVRKHTATMVVAMITAAVTASVPAIAATVVPLAKNALHLGGKPKSFFLPKTGTAANANKLGGVAATGYYRTTDTVAQATQAANATQFGGLSVDQALPLVRAQNDASDFGTDQLGSGQVQVDSLSITAPGAGFLIISGNVFVNNNSGGGPQPYVLVPLLDGVPQTATGWAGTFFMAPDSQAGERTTLGYTITVPVTAGGHTVSQKVGPFSGTSDFFWNNEHLTVMFIPGSRGAVTRAPTKSTTSSRMGR